MNRRTAIRRLATFFLTTASLAHAQQPKKVPRIGFISPLSSSTGGANLEAFRQGLRDLGYRERENIHIEVRWAEGSAERLPHLIAELIRLKVDVLVIGGAAGALAAKNAGITTPVVFAAVTDPLGYGLIDSLARPGGNITGLALALGEGFSGKWVEILKETVPKVARLAVLRNPAHPLAEVFLRETQAAGRAHSVRLDFFEARDPNDLGSTLSRLEKERAKALIVTPSPLFSSQRSRLVEFAARRRLPSMFFAKEYVDAGGLMSYGPSFPDSYRRAATYVDKILKGTKPADLPVEQPMKFEFVINLKTAKQIGLTIPQWTLMKADKVIQ
ncbi:MAG: ABC transporter substrate-binding protein [Deltaproteobacteria bacterium]|nr:ABC transporter substrate-binding protein [Deltaproteobacteria bacterium]MBI3066431.1 ABC transporter substrate-binding protein [Deltaproteobacteria bacterium]